MRSFVRIACLAAPLAVLSVSGCAPLVCGEGTEEVDGVCEVQPVETTDPLTMEEALDGALTCEPLSAGGPGELDLEAGCVGTACVDDTFSDFVEHFGSEPTCTDAGTFYLHCDFEGAVRVLALRSVEDSSVPDPNDPLNSVTLLPESEFRTTDGLGVGAHMGCFVEVLGYPEIATLGPTDSGWTLASATWLDGHLEVLDGAQPVRQSDADGVVDRIVLR